MQYQNLKDISKHVNDLVYLLSENTGIIDLQPLFFNFTLSTTTALIFGRSVASLSEEKQEAFGRNFDYALAICAMRIRPAEFHWAYTPSKYNQACSVVKNFASDFVDQALKLRIVTIKMHRVDMPSSMTSTTSSKTALLLEISSHMSLLLAEILRHVSSLGPCGSLFHAKVSVIWF